MAKTFGPFQALKGVSLDVYPGEVHALLGDNGARQSRHLSRYSRVYSRRAQARSVVDGADVNFSSPRDSAALGIGTVYQDLALAPLMSVSRNFFMGRELFKGPKFLGILNDAEMDRISLEQMHKTGINADDPRQPVGTMSGGQRQTLAISRAIYFGAKVLILDEPTSALGQKQQMEVLKTIMRVRARGDIAIVLITHNEIHAQLTADRFTFLALGEVIGQGTTKDIDHNEIRRLMAGGAEMADLEQEIQALAAN